MYICMDGYRQDCMNACMHRCTHIYAYIHAYRMFFLVIGLSIKEYISDHRSVRKYMAA